MTFSFNAALTGLNANSNRLNVVGNNIANANTIGFRSSSVTFMDLFAERYGVRLNGAGNSLSIGNGVQTGSIHTNFAQGNLNESSSPIHAAIQGNGYFVVRNSDGTSGYTRAGDFTANNQGFLVASNGGNVQGYLAQNGVIPPGAALTDLRIPLGQTMAPHTTTAGTMHVNLSSETATGGEFHSVMQVFDSLGKERSLDLKFTRQANGSFQMTGTLDGNPIQTSVDGGGASSTPVSFTFDSSGRLTAPATSLSIIPDQTQLNGATLPSIDLKLYETNPNGSQGASNFTSFAEKSAKNSVTQDGFGAGELNGAAVDPYGNIYGVFSNGQSRIVGQYALATFVSNDGLGRSGGNMFTETIASGQATIDAPGSGGRGLVAGGYLESSNVNITNEFVDLIEAQRGFQANSRVITSLNQTFQDLLQII